jgi:hypothetical protein
MQCEGLPHASNACVRQQELEERARQEEKDRKLALKWQADEHIVVDRPAQQQTGADSAARRGPSNSVGSRTEEEIHECSIINGMCISDIDISNPTLLVKLPAFSLCAPQSGAEFMQDLLCC